MWVLFGQLRYKHLSFFFTLSSGHTGLDTPLPWSTKVERVEGSYLSNGQNKFDYCPSGIASFILLFHKCKSVPLGPI